MKTLQIGSHGIPIKDYYCADVNGLYLPKADGKLWLYINLTQRCNAGCPFCINPAVNTGTKTIAPDRLAATLEHIAPFVDGVSITGSEPMLYPALVDEVSAMVLRILGPQIALELTTNGTNLERLLASGTIDRLSAVHISRHHVQNEANTALMGFPAPSFEQIERFVSRLEDPAKVVLNCVLQRGGVSSAANACAYLEWAAAAGIRNTSFVAMAPANAYCKERYVSPETLQLSKDERFNVWNEYHDYAFCCCSSGDYHAASGYIRYYYRCPDAARAPYMRQLVYDADDRMLAGLGGEEIHWE